MRQHGHCGKYARNAGWKLRVCRVGAPGYCVADGYVSSQLRDGKSLHDGMCDIYTWFLANNQEVWLQYCASQLSRACIKDLKNARNNREIFQLCLDYDATIVCLSMSGRMILDVAVLTHYLIL